MDLARTGMGTQLFAFLCSATVAQRAQLVVYTALEPDQIKTHAAGFERVHPDIEIKWRDSPTVISLKGCLTNAARSQPKRPHPRGMDPALRCQERVAKAGL